ncbi:MAG: EAL domain-containing protein [Pseudoxanthomonas sp.]
MTVNGTAAADPTELAPIDGHTASDPRAAILIVDDEPVNCRILETFLGLEGYITLCVHSAADALKAMIAWTPDLVLLDAMMPVMNGYDLARILKSDPETAGIPIIMITGLSGHASKITSLESGVDGHLTKPVDRNELCLRVRSLVKLKGNADHHQSQSDLLAQQVLKSNHELKQLVAAVDSTTDIVALVDRKTMRWIQVNAAAVKFFGYSRQELLTMGPDQVMQESREQLEGIYDALIEGKAESKPAEAWIRGGNGTRVHFEVNRHAICDGVNWTIVIVARDITERKFSEERLRQLAFYDSLTELPNRTLFEEHLDQAIQQAAAWKLQLTLLYLDLDNFRGLNESLGRPTADRLLREASKRVSECLSPRDTLARLGSDEFAVITLTPLDTQRAVDVSGKLLAAFREPFEIDGHTIHVSVSIGMALYPNDAEDMHSLARFADLAMDAAKQGGKNMARFYTAEMNLRALDKLKLEEALRGAVERNEFLLHYQPKICLRSGRWTGVEALLRWDRPGHGIVSPGVFMPSLEATGLIVQVGAWALSEACSQLALWEKDGVGPLPIAVNVSALQLVRQDSNAMLAELGAGDGQDPANAAPVPISSLVAGCLQGLTLPKGLLEIEITESVMMADAERNVSMLHQLKEMGIRLYLDDFGTGYSSLSYLARFPLDAVKIDGSFIRDLPTSPHDAAITQAIIQMSHQLGLKVIAECVETAGQVEFLRAHGCDEAQGFFFSRPMPVENLEQAWRDAGGICTQAAFEIPDAETQAFDSAQVETDPVTLGSNPV